VVVVRTGAIPDTQTGPGANTGDEPVRRLRLLRLAIGSAGLALALVSSGPSTGARAQDPPQDPQMPTFKAGTSGVMVDVSVRDARRRSVTGLQRQDFEVYDNGVLQQVDEASYGKLPIDITIALDVSYSVSGTLLDRLRSGVVQLMRDLGRDDRLKLILFNMRVTRIIDFTRDVKAVERAIRTVRAGGGTALHDALSVALVSGSHPDRRQLIVVFTDGSDSSSITRESTLTSVAQRTRATLAFVMPGTGRPTITSGNRVITLPIAPLFNAPSPIFTTLVRETGGTILPVGSGSDLSAAFRTVLNDFRSCYVLYYSAQGVDRDGYHAIEVKVKREGAVVQARRGYFGS
jgi:Ca-activated chloride channel family protein